MPEQKQPTDVFAFLLEILERLKQKSPKFFRVWNTINSIIFLLAGLPVILTQFGITDLNLLPAYVSKIITFASAWGLLMNKLTVQGHPEIVQSDNGTLLQKPSPDLPFTEKKEDIKIVEIKNDEPPK